MITAREKFNVVEVFHCFSNNSLLPQASNSGFTLHKILIKLKHNDDKMHHTFFHMMLQPKAKATLVTSTIITIFSSTFLRFCTGAFSAKLLL